MTQEQKLEIDKAESMLAAGYTPADLREIGYAFGAVSEAVKRAIREAGPVTMNEY